MDRCKGKVAIVTGGASGIGRALCEELARRGAIVVVTDINAESAGRVASAITSTGGRAYAAYLDVTQSEDVQGLIEKAALEYGRLDYVFNNAGITIAGDMRDMTIEHWRRILDVNIWGVIHGTTAAYQVMVKQGFGHIVNTSSGAGLFPSPLNTAYATTKHAVVGLSSTLRAEAAGLGIKVSVVCPGFIQTGIFDSMTQVTRFRGKDPASDYLSSIKMMDAATCVRIILRGVARNKSIIPVTGFVRLFWLLYRLHPDLLAPMHRKMATDFQALRSES